jgi:hypothetical protein
MVVQPFFFHFVPQGCVRGRVGLLPCGCDVEWSGGIAGRAEVDACDARLPCLPPAKKTRKAESGKLREKIRNPGKVIRALNGLMRELACQTCVLQHFHFVC